MKHPSMEQDKYVDDKLYKVATYKVIAATRSSLVKLNPALYFMNSFLNKSYETSVPKATAQFPTTPDTFTIGFADRKSVV